MTAMGQAWYNLSKRAFTNDLSDQIARDVGS